MFVHLNVRNWGLPMLWDLLQVVPHIAPYVSDTKNYVYRSLKHHTDVDDKKNVNKMFDFRPHLKFPEDVKFGLYAKNCVYTPIFRSNPHLSKKVWEKISF